MEIKFVRANLQTCAAATGVVVVIDVIRAFTTAAFAFDQGASEILLVRTVEEALALQQRFPEALLMGEVGGLPIEGFHFGNSPSEVRQVDFGGRRLVQRTSRGTQGAALSAGARQLFAASFVCAAATVRAVQRCQPRQVTFVVTGVDHGQLFDGRPIVLGDEDAACADYLEARLRGESPDPAPYLARVRQAPNATRFTSPAHPEFPAADLAACVDLDRFDFAMPVERTGDLLRMVKL
jgi:2-phosphosulfolactate phosphatase